MKLRLWSIVALLVVTSVLVTACGGGPAPEPTEAPAASEEEQEPAEEEPSEEEPAGTAKVSMWSHAAGNPKEIAAVEQMIADFNGMQEDYEIVLESFPQESYNDSVQGAAIAGDLPCILDLDGPTVPNFAWSEYIQPLPVSEEELDEIGIIPQDVGRYKGTVYSLGQFDVALLIYGRKSVLEKYDIRIPTLDEPWTKEEFDEILKTLQDSGEFEYALDVNAGWTGEWWPYAMGPMLWSFGGSMIDRDTYLTAEGILNGPEAQAWGEWFHDLFEKGYVNPNPADIEGFNQGRVALWYNGSWSADPATEAWGDDLLFLPAVDFGEGPKIGAGSWQWAISATCEESEGAWEFISYMMEPEQIALMSETTALIPTTPDGAALTETFQEGGKYRIFYDMLDRFAMVRPRTPAYLTISSEFEQAATLIRDGGNVLDALDDAVDAIERDIEDNDGYGFEE